MGRKSRDKGKRGEREACEVLRPLWPNVRRRAMQARGGAEGADLENTPGYHVEVGCGNVNPRAKWEQADADLHNACTWNGCDAKGTEPIALTRKDRGEWLVTMSAGHFRELERTAALGRKYEAALKALETLKGKARGGCTIDHSDPRSAGLVCACQKNGLRTQQDGQGEVQRPESGERRIPKLRASQGRVEARSPLCDDPADSPSASITPGFPRKRR